MYLREEFCSLRLNKEKVQMHIMVWALIESNGLVFLEPNQGEEWTKYTIILLTSYIINID